MCAITRAILIDNLSNLEFGCSNRKQLFCRTEIENVTRQRELRGTTTEFCVPDYQSQAAIMSKFRAFMLNPDLFRTTFWHFGPDPESFT